MADSQDPYVVIAHTSKIVAAQLAYIQVNGNDDTVYFDNVFDAYRAVKDQTCAAALFCTTDTATDEYDMPCMQDVVVSVCAANQLGVQTTRSLPYVRVLGRPNLVVKVVGTTDITVVHALLSDDLRQAALAGRPTQQIGTIRIVPNLAQKSKLGLVQRLLRKLYC